jgi:hypothetical protein
MNGLIEIGGEKRAVNFGRNFWSEVEGLTGKTVGEILAIKELTSIKNQTAIAFSSLKWGLYEPKTGTEPNPKFTMYQVADWIDEKPEVMSEFYKHLTESLPTKKKEEVSDPK